MYLCRHIITEDMFLTSKKELADFWSDQGDRFTSSKMTTLDNQQMVGDLVEQVNEEYEQHRG